MGFLNTLNQVITYLRVLNNNVYHMAQNLDVLGLGKF